MDPSPYLLVYVESHTEHFCWMKTTPSVVFPSRSLGCDQLCSKDTAAWSPTVTIFHNNHSFGNYKWENVLFFIVYFLGDTNNLHCRYTLHSGSSGRQAHSQSSGMVLPFGKHSWFLLVRTCHCLTLPLHEMTLPFNKIKRRRIFKIRHYIFLYKINYYVW